MSVSSENLNVRRFRPEHLCLNPRILIVGPRASGKMTLINQLLDCMKCPKDARVLFYNSEYRVPNDYLNITKQEDIKTLDAYVATVSKINKTTSNTTSNDTNANVVVFSETCFLKKRDWCSKSVQQLMLNGRFYGCAATIVEQQSITQIPADLRCQFEYVFLARQSSPAQQRQLWVYFGGMFDFETFCQVLNACTRDYEFMVLDFSKQSDKNSVFYYKVPLDAPVQETTTSSISSTMSSKVDTTSSSSVIVPPLATTAPMLTKLEPIPTQIQTNTGTCRSTVQFDILPNRERISLVITFTSLQKFNLTTEPIEIIFQNKNVCKFTTKMEETTVNGWLSTYPQYNYTVECPVTTLDPVTIIWNPTQYSTIINIKTTAF